jgi:hypothetical protein
MCLLDCILTLLILAGRGKSDWCAPSDVICHMLYSSRSNVSATVFLYGYVQLSVMIDFVPAIQKIKCYLRCS